MSKIRQIIREEIRRIMEVRILGNSYQESKPLKDSETIRVYHGFGGYSKKYAFITAKYGILGNVWKSRVFSYETANNPKGLFVTTNPKVAMNDFGQSGVVIEFHTKVSKLEAPVWNSEHGSWFGVGSSTKGFEGRGTPKFDVQRNKRRIQNRRAIKSNNEDGYKNKIPDVVVNSDRPELAHSLMMSSERQALFTGVLNPNMIRAFWVQPYYLTNGKEPSRQWERMGVKEFNKRFAKYSDGDDDGHGWYLFKPNDNLRNYKNALKLATRAYDKEMEKPFMRGTTFIEWLSKMENGIVRMLSNGGDDGVVYAHQAKDFLKFIKYYKETDE